MYDTKWDGQSTHRCSSWHQKQTTGRGHRFESHNSLGSESSPARCSPFGAFPLLPTECFENLTFHYRPAVWHATIATLTCEKVPWHSQRAAGKWPREALAQKSGNRASGWRGHSMRHFYSGGLLLLLIFPHISPISRTRGHRRRLPFPYHRYIQKTQKKRKRGKK